MQTVQDTPKMAAHTPPQNDLAFSVKFLYPIFVC